MTPWCAMTGALAPVLLLFVLSGCAEAPTSSVTTRVEAPASSAGPSASSDPSPTASATTTPAPPAPVLPSPSVDPRVIGFGSVGDLTIDLTAEQIGDQLSATTDADTGNPSCAVARYGGGDPGDDALLAESLSVLAESHGAFGRVDVLELGVLSSSSSGGGGRLPRTASGIGLGSTLMQVRAAYDDGLRKEETGHYDPESLEVTVTGPDSTAIVFFLGPDRTVQGISTGRLPQVRYIEHCL